MTGAASGISDEKLREMARREAAMAIERLARKLAFGTDWRDEVPRAREALIDFYEEVSR